jgi:hypothetical protein
MLGTTMAWVLVPEIATAVPKIGDQPRPLLPLVCNTHMPTLTPKPHTIWPNDGRMYGLDPYAN